MLIIGCDYHPSFQQIAFVDTTTGEYGGQRLEHMEGAGQFYRVFAPAASRHESGWKPAGTLAGSSS